MADEEQSPEGDALLLYRRADELQGRIAETELRVESLASEIAQIESREAPDYPEEAYRLDDCDKMYAEAKELYNELANRKNQSIFGMLRDCYRMERIREGGMVVACNERDQIHRENPGLAERLERCEAEFREDKALAKNTLAPGKQKLESDLPRLKAELDRTCSAAVEARKALDGPSRDRLAETMLREGNSTFRELHRDAENQAVERICQRTAEQVRSR